jgi:hypothetical protein
MFRKARLGAAFLLAAAFGLVWSGSLTPAHFGDLVSQAQAIIGRPLTPMSYAGVARRTAVRADAYTGAAFAGAAVAGAAVAGAAAVGAAEAAGCTHTYNAYGQSVTTCP